MSERANSGWKFVMCSYGEKNLPLRVWLEKSEVGEGGLCLYSYPWIKLETILMAVNSLLIYTEVSEVVKCRHHHNLRMKVF